MALTSIPQVFPPVGVTVSRALVPTIVAFENGTNCIIDTHAVINSAIRLIKRLVLTPVYTGGAFRMSIQELEYPANYNSTYVPTNVGTALTAPFTLALGTQKGEVEFTALQTMLPTIYLAAGDTLAA